MWKNRAKVVRVIDHRQVQVQIDLRFGVSVRRIIKLNGYPVSETQEENAKSCLILLIGGHRLVLQTEEHDIDPDNDIYMKAYVGGEEMVQGTLENVGDARLANVNKAMLILSEDNYPTGGLAAKRPKRRKNG